MQQMQVSLKKKQDIDNMKVTYQNITIKSDIDDIIARKKQGDSHKKIGALKNKSERAIGQQIYRYNKKMKKEDSNRIEKIVSIAFVIDNIPRQHKSIVKVKRRSGISNIVDMKELTMDMMLAFQFEEYNFKIASNANATNPRNQIGDLNQTCCSENCLVNFKKDLWMEIRSNFKKFTGGEKNTIIKGLHFERSNLKSENYQEHCSLGIIELCEQVFRYLFDIERLCPNTWNSLPQDYFNLLKRLSPGNFNTDRLLDTKLKEDLCPVCFTDQKLINTLTCPKTKQLFYDPVVDLSGFTFEKLNEDYRIANLDKKEQVMTFVLSFYESYKSNSIVFKGFKDIHLFLEWSLKNIASAPSPNKMLSVTFLINYYEFEQYNDQKSNFAPFVNWSREQIYYKDSEFKEPCIWFLKGLYDYQNDLEKVNTVLLHSIDLDRVVLFYKGRDMKLELIAFIQSSNFTIEEIVNGLW